MARTRITNNSRKAAKAARAAIRASKNAALHDICRDLYEASVQNNGRIPHRYVSDVVNELKPTWSWLTRDIINSHLIKYKKNLEGIKKTKKSDDPSLVGFEIMQSSKTQISHISGTSSNNSRDRCSSATMANDDRSKNPKVADRLVLPILKTSSAKGIT